MLTHLNSYIKSLRIVCLALVLVFGLDFCFGVFFRCHILGFPFGSVDFPMKTLEHLFMGNTLTGHPDVTDTYLKTLNYISFVSFHSSHNFHWFLELERFPFSQVQNKLSPEDPWAENGWRLRNMCDVVLYFPLDMSFQPSPGTGC